MPRSEKVNTGKPAPDMEYSRAVARYVSALVDRSGLSKVEVADRAEVSHDTVYRLTDHRAAWSVKEEKLAQVVRALGHQPPRIGRVLLLAESPQKPQNPRDWIAQAVGALEEATGLLDAQEQAATDGRVQTGTKVRRKHQKPGDDDASKDLLGQ